MKETKGVAVPTPSELGKAVAAAFGVSEASVAVHDRNLLLGGLRTAGGRGRGAAQVTATDAATLLIAVAGSRNVKDSVKTVNTHGSVHGFVGWESSKLLPTPELLQLPAKHTFLDALIALIESAAHGTLEQVASETVGEQVNLLSRNPDPKLQIEVELTSHIFNLIKIELYTDTEAKVGHPRKVPTAEEGRLYFLPAQRFLSEYPNEDPDLVISSRFTHRTIMKIGNLLREQPAHG
jgi:hypothetical protein